MTVVFHSGRSVTARAPISLVLAFLFTTLCINAQDIPLGQWRMHLSYNRIHNIAVGPDKIFAASTNGVMVYDKTDNSISTYSKINGLSGGSITCISFDETSQKLLIAYEDGGLDIVHENIVSTFDRLKESNVISGSKRINQITVHNGYAYLTADFGVVVFDIGRSELKETWRAIGASGLEVNVFGSAIVGNTIFLATSRGVQSGDLNQNLLDYNNWQHHTPLNSTMFKAVAELDGNIYAAISGQGLFKFETNNWSLIGLQTETFSFLNSGTQSLLIGTTAGLRTLSANTITTINSDKITAPLHADEDALGTLWIGDEHNGLLNGTNGNLSSFMPNGPSTNEALRLKSAGGKIYAIAGGFSPERYPMGNSGTLNLFSNGAWSAESTTIDDVTDIDFMQLTTIVSSYGDGLESEGPQGASIINETNSPLRRVSSPSSGVLVTAISSSTDGLWVANYGASSSLHLLKQDFTWDSFTFSNTSARYPLDLLVDSRRNVWMLIDPIFGGGLAILTAEGPVYVNSLAGSGALPSNNVISFAEDRDGQVWVGTDAGVAFMYSPNDDAIKPIFENRFLLKDEQITSIAVDGGNRKWIGTTAGAWLFNPAGDELISHFTAENSPLLSNDVKDIEIDPVSGEVFFATSLGIVSYRGTATDGRTDFENVKIFPNPLTSSFSGLVAITGLTADAIVKITDVSGKLVWQSQASGGTASWNGRDVHGSRVATGVYLVFASTPDGRESAAGKIAVVE